MNCSGTARAILGIQGREVELRRDGAEPQGLTAIVSDYGFGPAPSNWPEGFGSTQARHAAFRLHPQDADPRYGDTVTWDGLDYEIRAVRPEPSCSGPDGPMWRVALGVADPRGGAA